MCTIVKLVVIIFTLYEVISYLYYMILIDNYNLFKQIVVIYSTKYNV